MAKDSYSDKAALQNGKDFLPTTHLKRKFQKYIKNSKHWISRKEWNDGYEIQSQIDRTIKK